MAKAAVQIGHMVGYMAMFCKPGEQRHANKPNVDSETLSKGTYIVVPNNGYHRTHEIFESPELVALGCMDQGPISRTCRPIADLRRQQEFNDVHRICFCLNRCTYHPNNLIFIICVISFLASNLLICWASTTAWKCHRIFC